jgi:protein-tyrosine-phosphatase
LIDAAAKRSSSTSAPAPASSSASAPAPSALDGAALAKIVGHAGEQTGPVYKITIGRSELTVREHGATINARMGLNTWAAFAGSNADAMVAGDVAMLEHEVTPVLKVLRANGINVVAIHHHMTEVQPIVVFLHYYGTGPAEQLARGVRAAVDVLGKIKAPASHASHGAGVASRDASNEAAKQVLFMCPHGAAKSVLASAYFQRLAKERGLNVRVDSAGTDPDPEVGKAVAAHLTKTGYAIPVVKPRRVTANDIEQADVVVSLGCDLAGLPQPRGKLLKWDVPGPSENFAAADEAIRKRVEELVDELARATRR